METTREFLHNAAEWSALIVDGMAILVVVVGSVVSFVQGARWLISPDYAARVAIRTIWIWYARWLVAALTFLLAADIIETISAPSYEDLIRLAVIAGIRTFLNYFLDKDLREFQAMEGQEAKRPLG